MSSFTFADNKLGGRLMTAADAIAAGKLRTAAGILNEVAEELNVEAEATDGLLAEEEAPAFTPTQTYAEGQVVVDPKKGPLQALAPQPTDLQSCARGAHNFGAADPVSGWRTCSTCGQVNVAPPDNNGPIDMGARQ